MIKPKIFFEKLQESKFRFFTGVPDSLLKDFCAYLTENTASDEHVITANEGSAIALAAGYNLATNKPGVVYMQNSGFGNSINPLLSLADPEVYSIPMLVIIGWRGEPGKKDEPQHTKQGRVQIDLIKSLGYEYKILSDNTVVAMEQVDMLKKIIMEKSTPAILLVRKGTFDKYSLEDTSFPYNLNREDALKIVLDTLNDDDLVVSTTGKTSREIYEYRDEVGLSHENDFLTVGSMGHTSMIALGIAIKTSNKVYCLDGDGSVIMHMGNLTTVGHLMPQNFIHIVLNNGAHDSVGGQPTAGFNIDMCSIAKSCRYTKVFRASTKEEIQDVLNKTLSLTGPIFIEIIVNKGARDNLGRPKTTPLENKIELMKKINSR